MTIRYMCERPLGELIEEERVFLFLNKINFFLLLFEWNDEKHNTHTQVDE